MKAVTSARLTSTLEIASPNAPRTGQAALLRPGAGASARLAPAAWAVGLLTVAIGALLVAGVAMCGLAVVSMSPGLHGKPGARAGLHSDGATGMPGSGQDLPCCGATP